MKYLEISYKYGKSKKALIKACEEGYYAIGEVWPEHQSYAKINDGITCFSKPLGQVPTAYLDACERYLNKGEQMALNRI